LQKPKTFHFRNFHKTTTNIVMEGEVEEAELTWNLDEGKK